jgi:O-antigen ligase/tetratricopeptide (TPR) repeat protein
MEETNASAITHHPVPAQWARSLFIALLPVFAVFLGGATSKWAEGVIVALLGLFLMFQPPRRSLGWKINTVFVAFALCGLVSFLPQAWFFTPDWRTALQNDFGITLPNTVTPQPWITLGCFASLVAGLCWLYRVSAQELELRVARFQLRLFAAGIVAIAALSILVYLTHQSIPFWRNERNFGPFLNRNQTADLFGITSVLILASGQDDIRHGRTRWVFWIFALAILIAGICLNFSRAGILILVASSAIWIATVAMRLGAPARAGAACRISLAVSFILILVSGLLLAGGPTLERFHLQKFAGSDFQWLIFQDAWQFIRSSPWVGLGLGNFESVFAIFRDASHGTTAALHPESDWFWVSSEMGWLAIPLIIVGAVLLIRRVAPLEVGTNQRFRLAALIGAVMFALHGLVDVSGHRVGTAYSALFLLGLSLHRPTKLLCSKTTEWIFRLLGLVLFAIGLSWPVAWRSMAMLPGAVGVNNAKQLAIVASRGHNFAEAINLTTRALNWAPLDSELYYLRGAAEVAQREPEQKALDDFHRARFLEPNSASLPLQEGFVWLRTRPDLAEVAWREALRRAGAQRKDVFRNIMFTADLRDPTSRPIIRRLAFSEHDLALVYFEELNALEFRPAFSKFFDADPDLTAMTPDQKREFFQLWDSRGDINALVAVVNKHPEWLQYTWRAVAKHRASSGDFRGACELMEKYDSKTVMPPEETGQSLERLRDRVYRGTNDFSAAYTLYRQQIRQGSIDEALATIRHFTFNRNPPVYFYLLEAQAWAAKNSWEKSWNAWSKFEELKQKETAR